MVETDAKKATQEEITKGLALLKKQEDYKERVRRGEVKGPTKWKDLTEEQKDKARLQAKKYAIGQRILKEKAAKAGITVSPAEVEAEIRAGKAK